MNRRQFLATSAAAGVGLAAGPALAYRAVFCAKDGVALDGYDAVSYFAAREPRRGRRDIGLMWKGAVWYFATPAHRDIFEANPWSMAPRYGGYCAYALSQGQLKPGSPRAWQLSSGRLYLTQDEATHDRWLEDMPGNIARADANWPDILRSSGY